MGTYSFHPDAVTDLNDIWEYIALDSANAADLVLNDIENAINLLASTPFAGHQRPDLSSRSTRFWLVHSYLIAYIPEQPIIVTAILHGRRNPRIMASTEKQKIILKTDSQPLSQKPNRRVTLPLVPTHKALIATAFPQAPERRKPAVLV